MQDAPIHVLVGEKKNDSVESASVPVQLGHIIQPTSPAVNPGRYKILV